jgi:hypothetical protein
MEDAFFKLCNPQTDLTCNLIAVNRSTEALAEKLRDMFISSMTNYGYVGFSREIDNIFHYHSIYLYITDQRSEDNIIMVGRVTPRLDGKIVPFEMGTLKDKSSYTIKSSEPIVDINTFTYVKGHYERAMPLITAGFGHCASMLNAKKAYCLFDVENDNIRDKYLSIKFTLSEEFPDPVEFESFRKTIGDSSKPVSWRVMEWSDETIKYYADLAKEFYIAK